LLIREQLLLVYSFYFIGRVILTPSQFVKKVREQRKYGKVGVVGCVTLRQVICIAQKITKDTALEDPLESDWPRSISLIA